jgi:hypothetical protein
MIPHTPLLCLIACGLALPAAAQARADTPRHTECHNVGVTVVCTSATPVSATEAFRIFTSSTAPYVGEEAVPFVPPVGSKYIGRIYGDVFSDRWPFESAGIYSRFFTERRTRHPRVVSPWLDYGTRLAVDPVTGRRYR